MNGKWKYMMSLRQNYDGSSSYFMLPLMEECYMPAGDPKLAVQAESEQLDRGGFSCHVYLRSTRIPVKVTGSIFIIKEVENWLGNR